MTLIEKINDIDIHIKIKISSCLIIIFLGVLPSILNCNWLWLSRSGSLLVVFGVYIAWRDYKGEIDGVLSIMKEGLKQMHHKNMGKIIAKEKGIINTEMKKGAAIQKHEEGMELIEGIQDNNKKTYENIEFIVIGIGTIIWGYGDLPNKLFC